MSNILLILGMPLRVVWSIIYIPYSFVMFLVHYTKQTFKEWRAWVAVVIFPVTILFILWYTIFTTIGHFFKYVLVNHSIRDSIDDSNDTHDDIERDDIEKRKNRALRRSIAREASQSRSYSAIDVANNCYKCHGSGFVECFTCSGTGRKSAFMGIGHTEELCKSCYGKGMRICKH